jgi:hypothetical protein
MAKTNDVPATAMMNRRWRNRRSARLMYHTVAEP